MPYINADANWYHSFQNLQLSSKEFYDQVTKAVQEKEIPKIKISTASLAEGGVFAGNRLYLRIQRSDFAFEICAAPFGKDFFISWWLGEINEPIVVFLLGLPIIGWLLQRVRGKKTYYFIDTEAMFKDTIHAVILDVIDSITAEKGLQALSASQREIKGELLLN